MRQRSSRHLLWILPVLLVGLSVPSLYAAAQMGNDTTVQAVSGCLQKGLETGGYFIVSADGKHWELYPDKDVSLAEHVGHTVSASGTITKRTATQEEKSQPYEKKEITGKQHSDFHVSGIKMISDTCTK